MTFESLNLPISLMRAIEARDYVSPTEIQHTAIPEVINGRDLIATAQTGTGKTGAFILPILKRFIENPNERGRGPRALVLSPTRELASQIEEDTRLFARFMRLRFGSVLGGMPYPPQVRRLQNPLDLLVATPGRLLDHLQHRRVDLSQVEVLVLDEADRMLDLGFINDIRRIVRATPQERQTLLFSATIDRAVQSIANEMLKDPITIQLAVPKDKHELIDQRIFQVDDLAHKHRLLVHHLSNTPITQALIFTATKRSADRLAKILAGEGHNSAALHGDMRQNARRRTMDNLRSGKLRLLVATDVASRGLDVKGISHVINFDIPKAAEEYIHRIGRTGRAGVNGTAISLVGPGDWSYLGDIERLTGQSLQRDVIPGLEPQLPEPRIRSSAQKGRSWNPSRNARKKHQRSMTRGKRRLLGA